MAIEKKAAPPTTAVVANGPSGPPSHSLSLSGATGTRSACRQALGARVYTLEHSQPVWHAPEPHAAGAAGGQPRKRPRARCAPALEPAVCSRAGGGSTTQWQRSGLHAHVTTGETPVSIPIPSPRFAAPFQHQVCRPRKDHDSGSTQWQMTHISKTTHQADNYNRRCNTRVYVAQGLPARMSLPNTRWPAHHLLCHLRPCVDRPLSSTRASAVEAAACSRASVGISKPTRECIYQRLKPLALSECSVAACVALVVCEIDVHDRPLCMSG